MKDKLTAWVKILDLTFTSDVTLDNLLNLSKPQFSQFKLMSNYRVVMRNKLLSIKNAISCYLFHSCYQFILILVVPLLKIYIPYYYENIFKVTYLRYF